MHTLKLIIVTLCLLLTQTLFAADTSVPWGVDIADKKLKIGGRLQGIALAEEDSQDMSLRRTRLNIEYKPWEGHKIVYDIRNDNSNENDRGEGKFQIGDAYWQIAVDSPWIKNIRLFRAKVDVSYSQTASSRNLFNPQRAESSEHASDFVVHNRRAANAQINGDLKKISYQLAVSDGVHSDDLEDVQGNEIDDVEAQKFSYGGKIRYFFWGEEHKDVIQDTLYNSLDTFSLGFGYFRNDRIEVNNSTTGGASNFHFQRTLTNIELSFAYKNMRVLAESFLFTGDLVDLSQASRDDILGESKGQYVQIEYYLGNWAPFVIVEEFDRNTDLDDGIEKINTFGLNYYDLKDARRYGIAYKEFKYGDDLSSDDRNQTYAYIMLNF